MKSHECMKIHAVQDGCSQRQVECPECENQAQKWVGFVEGPLSFPTPPKSPETDSASVRYSIETRKITCKSHFWRHLTRPEYASGVCKVDRPCSQVVRVQSCRIEKTDLEKLTLCARTNDPNTMRSTN